MREMTIDGRKIQDNGDCYIIAEIGHNHRGDVETAMEMFRVAKECGADAVKLQKRNNRELYTEVFFNKPYEHENSYGTTYGEHREALEFGWEEYSDLMSYAKEIGITLLSTAFDFSSADFLARLGIPAFKIASGDLKNTPFLKYVAKLGKPIILSTGGGTMEDVQRAYETIMPINTELCILQCTTGYPAAFDELNLNVIRTYRQRFSNILVGFSSHDNGIAMALVAYMLGARVVEKHFTINHTWKGTDHSFSLEPTGLRKMIRDLRRVKAALGNGVKSPFESEVAPLIKMGKKLVAARLLSKGHSIRREDIAIKSPGDGIPPYEIDKIIGRTTIRELKKDDDFTYNILNSKENGTKQTREQE